MFDPIPVPDEEIWEQQQEIFEEYQSDPYPIWRSKVKGSFPITDMDNTYLQNSYDHLRKPETRKKVKTNVIQYFLLCLSELGKERGFWLDREERFFFYGVLANLEKDPEKFNRHYKEATKNPNNPKYFKYRFDLGWEKADKLKLLRKSNLTMESSREGYLDCLKRIGRNLPNNCSKDYLLGWKDCQEDFNKDFFLDSTNIFFL